MTTKFAVAFLVDFSYSERTSKFLLFTRGEPAIEMSFIPLVIPLG
jgi:hypothetical protein